MELPVARGNDHLAVGDRRWQLVDRSRLFLAIVDGGRTAAGQQSSNASRPHQYE